MSGSDDEQQRDLVEGLRSVKETARSSPDERPKLAPVDDTSKPVSSLPRLDHNAVSEAPASPGRDELNASWDVASALAEKPQSAFGRLLSPMRGPLQQLVRFALGPLIERQVRMNSAQVRFDNEMVAYVDARLDRIERHYDDLLGRHGKRMEEIDERHLILQQELIRHVHDLVERIEFVFENAETNHLQVDAVVRETREELRQLVERVEALGAPSGRGR